MKSGTDSNRKSVVRPFRPPRILSKAVLARPHKDYLHFVTIALGSASEARYLADLATRLGLLKPDQFTELDQQADLLIRGLQNLLTSLKVERPS